MNILYYVALVVGLIIMSEGASYFWHRIGAHSDIVLPNIHDTHRIHHQADLDHQAHEDFYWVCIGLFALYVAFLVGYYLKIIDLIHALLIPTVISSVFIASWYIHSAYHIDDHWLNEYEWFRNKRELHFNHHYDPTVNYGILTHIPDILCGTFKNVEADDILDDFNFDLKDLTGI